MCGLLYLTRQFKFDILIPALPLINAVTDHIPLFHNATSLTSQCEITEDFGDRPRAAETTSFPAYWNLTIDIF